MKLIKRLRAVRRRTALGLLLSVLFIGTVSAAVYYQLANRTQVTVTNTGVKFCITGCAGGTNPADSTAAGAALGTNNTFVRFTGIKAYPNATAIYEQAVGISNTGSSVQVRLRNSAITGTSTSFSTIRVAIVDSANAIQGGASNYLTYTGGGSWTVSGSPTTLATLGATSSFFVRIEAKAAASNTLPADVATIDLFVEVV